MLNLFKVFLYAPVLIACKPGGSRGREKRWRLFGGGAIVVYRHALEDLPHDLSPESMYN